MINNQAEVVKFPRYGYITRIPHSGGKRCHACGVNPGKLHKKGCEEEICPMCFRKLNISHTCKQELPSDDKPLNLS